VGTFGAGWSVKQTKWRQAHSFIILRRADGGAGTATRGALQIFEMKLKSNSLSSIKSLNHHHCFVAFYFPNQRPPAVIPTSFPRLSKTNLL